MALRQTRPFLREIRHSTPPTYRQFVVVLEQAAPIRERIADEGRDRAALVQTFNDTIVLLDQFRQVHTVYSIRCIKQQAPTESGAAGTGGTDFAPLLNEARKITRETALKPVAKSSPRKEKPAAG